MAKPTKHYGKWRIRWVDANGRRRSSVHETYAEACFQLNHCQLEAEQIKRGLRSPSPTKRTFGDLCDYWHEHRIPQLRSPKDQRSILKRLRAELGPVPLQDLTPAHADRYVATRSDLKPKTLSNHLTLFTSMLRVAVDLRWLASVPRFRRPKIAVVGTEYRYLKSHAEIRRFLEAAALEGEHTHACYAMAVYTGMRAGEIAGLRWQDIDLNRRLAHVRRSFTGPTKNGRARWVPILDPLLPILRAWRLRHPGELVFTNRDGNMFGRSARVFQEVLHRVLEQAEFPDRDQATGKRYITFHDLRHTFASHWMMSGGDLFKLQRVLGHRSIDMTQRYAHLSPEAFTADYGRLGASSAAPVPLLQFPATGNFPSS